MPNVWSSFTPHVQNFKIPKIDFCDVITSVLYNRYCTDTAKDNLQTIGTEGELSLLILGIEMDMDVGTGGQRGQVPITFTRLRQSVPFHVTWLPSLKILKMQK